MADNDVDAIYSTQPQIDFARRMAESLLKQGNYVPDAAMAQLPGTWMYGVPNIIRAISGAQYRDIAGGQQEKIAAGVTGRQPNQVNRYGARVSQPNPNNAPSPGGPGPVAMRTNPSGEGPSDDFIHKLVTIESGGNPNARTGSYRGLGQFGPAEEKRYGIDNSNWNNPQVAMNAIKQHMDWLTPQLTQKLGRPPTDGELYLAHQQGVAGGPALLNNPDQPAWKAIRPYYKSDEMAKLAISGNIPKGNYLKSIPIDEVKASDFAKLWTSRFDSIDQTPKTIANTPGVAGGPQPNVPGTTIDNAPPNLGGAPRMGLGGPTPTEPMPGASPGAPPGAPPAQLAQAQGLPQVPNANPQISPGNNFGGFGIPPANPAYHPQQLDALIRAADPKDYPKIINDYFKQLQGTQREDIFGGTDVRPSGVPGVPDVVTHMAPKDTIPLGIEGLNLNMYMTPNGPHLLLPGGGDKGFSSVTELMRYAQKMKAEGEATGELTKERTGQVTQAQHEGIASVPAQRSIQQMMAISKATGKGMPSGPTKDFMKQFGQFYDNFVKGDKDKAWATLPEAEAFDKLNSYLASESTKAITSRGTNFDLQTFMRANPSLSQTKEGRELMLDILNQEFESKIQLGIAASKFQGKDVGEWQQFVKDYYDKHPIKVTLPTNGKTIIMKKITKEERDLLPSGTGYIAPDNNVYYKK